MKQNVHCEITHKDGEEKNEIQDIDAYIAEIVDENGRVSLDGFAAPEPYEPTVGKGSASHLQLCPDDAKLHALLLHDPSSEPSRIAAIELDYMTNYTIKMLSHLLDYYKLSRRKLNKTEMVQIIVIFEDDPTNEVIVATRRQLWKYMERLQDDEYLSQFIIFDGL